jgi:hypothetical protein
MPARLWNALRAYSKKDEIASDFCVRQGGVIFDAALRLRRNQICRSTIFSLSSAIASEGLRPFGQALAQFMMVWQR